eukprot:s7657_g2.t1
MHNGRVEIASEARSLAFALAGLRTCSRSAGCYEESRVYCHAVAAGSTLESVRLRLKQLKWWTHMAREPLVGLMESVLRASSAWDAWDCGEVFWQNWDISDRKLRATLGLAA